MCAASLNILPHATSSFMTVIALFSRVGILRDLRGRKSANIHRYQCVLFDWMFHVLINIFSVMSGRFLG